MVRAQNPDPERARGPMSRAEAYLLISKVRRMILHSNAAAQAIGAGDFRTGNEQIALTAAADAELEERLNDLIFSSGLVDDVN